MLELPLFLHHDAPKFACSYFHLIEGYLSLWFFYKAFCQQQERAAHKFCCTFHFYLQFLFKSYIAGLLSRLCWSSLMAHCTHSTNIYWVLTMCQALWGYLSFRFYPRDSHKSLASNLRGVFCWGTSLRDYLRSHACTASLGKMPLTTNGAWCEPVIAPYPLGYCPWSNRLTHDTSLASLPWTGKDRSLFSHVTHL